MRVKVMLHLVVVLLRCLVLWAAVLWLLPVSQSVRADPGALFVTQGGSGTACSQSQPCAVQTALARADYGDAIYMAAGTYTGSGSAVVTLNNSISLFGGWNGAPSGDVVRDPGAYRSILDGEGARRVVYAEQSIAFTLDGFIIQRGNATAGPDARRGGGIYSYGAMPFITNNIITGNTAGNTSGGPWAFGGGVHVESAIGAALIQGNQILNNVASGSGDAAGGGLCLVLADKAQVLDNVVLNNTASVSNGDGFGGGVAVIRSVGTTVLGNTIESNKGSAGSVVDDGRGGGVYVEESASVALKNNRVRNNVAGVAGAGYGGGLAAIFAPELVAASNLVEGNTAAATAGAIGSGGGLFVHSSLDVNITSNRVLGNIANPTAGQGGGLFIENGSSFAMTNNIVAGNRANISGGGLALLAYETDPVTGTLLHNTFVSNNGGSGDGRVAIYIGSDWINLTLINNLLSTHSYGLCAVGGTATLDRTLCWANSSGDTCGVGSIVNTDPITGDPRLDGTYHLRAGSAAIDAGMDAGVTTDIDGQDRPLDAGYDIGADEYTEPLRVYLPAVRRAR
jgi:hypothetical protein